MNATLLTDFGGRRFLLCVGCSAMTTLLQWFGKLDPAGLAYVAVIGGTVGAFIAGNVMQKRADTFANRDVQVAQSNTAGDSTQ
jgi:hypothetical protein